MKGITHPCCSALFREHEHDSRFTLSQAADIVLPAARGKALVRVEGLQLFGGQVAWLAVEQREVGKLAELCETNGPLYDLFDTGANHRVPVGAHQDDRLIAQSLSQRIAALDCAHESRALIDRRSVHGGKIAGGVQRPQLDWQKAEERAPDRERKGDG